MKWPVDQEVVRKFCERLKIEYEGEIENKALRDEIIFCLSKNVEALERLAARNVVTLYNLSVNDLIRSPLKYRIAGHPLEESSIVGEREQFLHRETEGFHKEVGTLTENECRRFRILPAFGKTAVATILMLGKLHRQTSGFKVLLGEMLSVNEQDALIGRMTEAVRTDIKVQRRLMSMFPPAAP